MTRRSNPHAPPPLATQGAISPHRLLVEEAYLRYAMPLRLWLRQCYPRADEALVEDAVADAFVHALERPEVFVRTMDDGGRGTLWPLFRTIAWRNLRGHFRKKARRWESPGIDDAAPQSAQTPQDIVASREIATRVLELIDVAAVRFGGSRPDALRTALHERLAGGTDTDAARAHGVPREYVNRAKRWIGTIIDVV